MIDQHDLNHTVYGALDEHVEEHHSANRPGTFMPIPPFKMDIDPDEGEDKTAMVVGIAQDELRRDEFDQPSLLFIVVTRNVDGTLTPKFSPWGYGSLPHLDSATS